MKNKTSPMTQAPQMPVWVYRMIIFIIIPLGFCAIWVNREYQISNLMALKLDENAFNSRKLSIDLLFLTHIAALFIVPLLAEEVFKYYRWSLISLGLSIWAFDAATMYQARIGIMIVGEDAKTNANQKADDLRSSIKRLGESAAGLRALAERQMQLDRVKAATESQKEAATLETRAADLSDKLDALPATAGVTEKGIWGKLAPYKAWIESLLVSFTSLVMFWLGGGMFRTSCAPYLRRAGVAPAAAAAPAPAPAPTISPAPAPVSFKAKPADPVPAPAPKWWKTPATAAAEAAAAATAAGAAGAAHAAYPPPPQVPAPPSISVPYVLNRVHATVPDRVHTEGSETAPAVPLTVVIEEVQSPAAAPEQAQQAPVTVPEMAPAAPEQAPVAAAKPAPVTVPDAAAPEQAQEQPAPAKKRAVRVSKVKEGNQVDTGVTGASGHRYRRLKEAVINGLNPSVDSLKTADEPCGADVARRYQQAMVSEGVIERKGRGYVLTEKYRKALAANALKKARV